MEAEIEQKLTEVEVIVIGAGIAGVVAANFLSKNKLDVIVVEASKNLGGRIKTQSIELRNNKQFNFDEGASWIHGYSQSNPIKRVAKMVKDLKIKKTDYESYQLFDQDSKNCNLQLQKYAKKLEKMIQKDTWKLDSNFTFQQAIEKIDQSLLSNKYFMHYLATQLEFDTSGTMDKLSAQWNDDQFNGDDMLLQSGYQKFVEVIAEQEGLKILLDHEVVKIIHINGRNIIQFKNGKKISAKNVVISASLGVLKSQKIEFSPELPLWKKNAIQSLGFGNVCKVNFLKAKSNFIGIAVENVNKRGLMTFFLNLHHLFNIPVLMTFGLGPNADQVQYMPEQELKQILASRLTIISKRQINQNQFKIWRTSWKSNPNILGAYSYGSHTTTAESWKNMQKPIYEYKWFFCGQHTISKYRGTVHGAYISGKNVAKIISQVSQ